MIASRRLRIGVLSAFVAACAVGCETRTGEEPRERSGPVGLPPWTIGGATLGMAAADVERVLGEPTNSRTSYGVTTTTWRAISVTFGKEGRAVEVFGDRLTSPSGATILTRGASEEDIVRQIGPGRLRNAYSPSSGVISCLSHRTGGTRTYNDAATLYEISIYQDRLASVRLLPR
jgi:hypothetical protein